MTEDQITLVISNLADCVAAAKAHIKTIDNEIEIAVLRGLLLASEAISPIGGFGITREERIVDYGRNVMCNGGKPEWYARRKFFQINWGWIENSFNLCHGKGASSPTVLLAGALKHYCVVSDEAFRKVHEDTLSEVLNNASGLGLSLIEKEYIAVVFEKTHG